jgi:hypothetical protein
MNLRFTYLDLYSIYLKLLAVLAVLGGLVSLGLLLYSWGKLTAFYDVFRTAVEGLGRLSSDFGLLNLPNLPLWPLLLLMLAIVFVMVTAALTLWALSAVLDLRLKLAQEERDARRLQVKLLDQLRMMRGEEANGRAPVAES